MKKEMVNVFLAFGLLLLTAVNARAEGLFGDGVHDDTATIQAMLDAGRSCVYLPPPPKEYRISKALELSSGQELHLDRFTTVRLAPNSGCAMVVNRNWQTGDTDIAVTGGRWEYDNVNQKANRLFTSEAPTKYQRDFDRGCIFIFDKVDRLTVRGVTFCNPVTYSCQLTRTTNFTVEDITFDFTKWNPKPINMDGIHLDGGCRHGRIANLRGRCFDDMVALNANDGICSAYEGEISDIDIDGLHAELTHRGVRILSTGAPIRNVSVRNVHISTYRNLVALTHFFPDRKTRGIFDNIVIRDSSVSAAPQPEELGKKFRVWPMIWVERGCDVGQLVIDNIVRRETFSTEDPTIGIEPGAKIDKLVVTNCRQVNETTGKLIFLSQEGDVGTLEQGTVSMHSCRDPLAEAREVLWTTLRDRFFCKKTEMLYDVLWRADDGTVSATACLPTPEEAARQYPNPCSWGTGLQDCVFNGGPYLAVALARGDREMAQSIFRGLRRCAEVSGVPGFVARGVLPSDGKGYYYNSSRDVWTLFVFYLWRYYHSDLCDGPTREAIRRLVVDVARYAESCVRPENGYNMLRADGKVGLATQMWVKNPKCRPWTDKSGWDFFEGLRVHEALRLPMFYAAAFDLSGDVHWREMKLRYLDDGITMAGGKIGPDIRASVLNQMQLSNRLLWETETDPDRKARLLRLLNRAADIARDHVTTRLAHDFAAGKWQVSKPIPDWHKAGFRSRNWGDGRVLNGYRYDIPDQPVFSIEDGYVEASHALLVQAMTPDREIDERTLQLFREATERLNLSDVACANAVNALLAMYQKDLGLPRQSPVR